MNELINAIRYSKTQTFRDKYRLIDVLMIAMCSLWTGKRTQEEFFQTFNAPAQRAEKRSLSIRLFAARDPLAGRTPAFAFRVGSDADIEPPDLETKVLS